MIARRIAATVIAVPAAVALAACGSSTTNGTGTNPTGGASSSSSSSSSSNASSAPSSASSTETYGLPTDVKGLYSAILTSSRKLSTQHLTLALTGAGQTITGEADQKLRDGKTVAMRLVETAPGSTTPVVIILLDGKVYAKLSPPLNTTGKPYVLLSKTSSDAKIRQLAGAFDSSLDSASTAQFATFTQAADEFKQVGPVTVNGTPAVRYAMKMNPSKLPPSYSGRAALIATGITSIPFQLDVDKQARLIAAEYDVSYQGRTIVTKITVGNFDQPVTITAPPASQVGVK